MHASLDQVRDTTIDAVDTARGRASELVTAGAERLVGSIEKGAEGLEGRIDHVVDRVPAVSLEVDRRGRRKWPLVLLLLALVVGGVAFARRRRAQDRGTDVGSAEAPKRFEVLPSEDGGWDVAGSEAGVAVSHHDTQAQGVERATRLAADAGGGEVVIHAVDGHPRDTRFVEAAGAGQR